MDILPRERRIASLLEQDIEWTARQREVLDLLARGRSNQEIADALGVSLDGAKWHLREILSKLNATGREDAAEYWRRRNSWPRRARGGALILFARLPRWAAAGSAAAVVVALAAIGIAIAFGGGGREAADDDITPSPTAQPSAVPTQSVSATPTSTPATPSPTTTPATQPPPARTVTFDRSSGNQPVEVASTVGPEPQSVFPPWDGASTVIYDTATGRSYDLGPGAQPASFSLDETMAVWAEGPEFAAGTEIFVIDLVSGNRRSLGPGRFAQFLTDGNVYAALPGSNDRVIIDPAAATRRPYAGESLVLAEARVPRAPAGYFLEPEPGAPSVQDFKLFDGTSGQPVLSFRAAAVAAAGPGQLAVVAPPVNGVSGVYLVDIASGVATYVADARPGRDNMPFSASADAILWTDEYCGGGPGTMRYFDRRSATLHTFAGYGPWAVLTTGGLIANGGFGAEQLIEPSTFSITTVIPPRPDGYGGDVWWSVNHRFASHGRYGGHGGLCS